jgi:hypothetical protein
MPIPDDVTDEKLDDYLKDLSTEDLRALLAEGLTVDRINAVASVLAYRPDEGPDKDQESSVEGSLDEDDAGSVDGELDEVNNMLVSVLADLGGASSDEDDADEEQDFFKTEDWKDALDRSFATSKSAVMAMVAHGTSSEQKRIPFFAANGMVLFGDPEEHSIDVNNYLGQRPTSGTVRFERNRLQANTFHFEGLDNANVEDLRDTEGRLKFFLETPGVYPYPDLNRVHYRWPK